MRPVPKSLLIHSAEFKSVNTDNSWQEEQTETAAVLEKIRIEPVSRLVTANSGVPKKTIFKSFLSIMCKNV